MYGIYFLTQLSLYLIIDNTLQSINNVEAVDPNLENNILNPKQCIRCKYGPMNLENYYENESIKCPVCYFSTNRLNDWENYQNNEETIKIRNKRQNMIYKRTFNTIIILIRSVTELIIFPTIFYWCFRKDVGNIISLFYIIFWCNKQANLQIKLFSNVTVYNTNGRGRIRERLNIEQLKEEYLKEIPCKIYFEEVCCICLNNISENSKKLIKSIEINKINKEDDIKQIIIKLYKEEPSLITLYCGHVFHYECIEISYKKNSRCPLCNKRFKLNNLLSDFLN